MGSEGFRRGPIQGRRVQGVTDLKHDNLISRHNNNKTMRLEADAEENTVPQFHVGLTGTTAPISVPNHEHIAGYRYVRPMQAYAQRVRLLPAHQTLVAS
jgi:hypothetical protein